MKTDSNKTIAPRLKVKYWLRLGTMIACYETYMNGRRSKLVTRKLKRAISDTRKRLWEAIEKERYKLNNERNG